MVLSNNAIRNQLKSSEIFIGLDDTKEYPVDLLRFDTMSVDLNLGSEFKVWKKASKGVDTSFDPSHKDFSLKDVAPTFMEDGETEKDGSYILKPNCFVLGTTKQFIKLSHKYSARLEGRSKLGRLGISVHITAPTIHAGFEGTITLEIYNHSLNDIRLSPWRSLDNPGLRIGQLIFETVEGDVESNDSRTFQGQNSVLGALKKS